MDWPFLKKTSCIAIGLMSGTSADGIDAAAVELTGWGIETKMRQLGFVTIPFSDETRRRILSAAEGESVGSRELCILNFYLGGLLADACEIVCRKSGLKTSDVDFVGSHGQTVWHEPKPVPYLGAEVRATLQIGEASVIAERLGRPVVSDFRVRDMAAGGLGAPLVPYTEYLLCRDAAHTVALQNIGGIGNITLLPAGGSLADTLAFDTGPGNMVMDALVARMTNGKRQYDPGGRLAAAGKVDGTLLSCLVENDGYLRLPPPKTTGREHYGAAFVDSLQAKGRAMGLSDADLLATATRYTAESIRIAVERFLPVRPGRMIVGGGGSRNPVLMRHLADVLPGCGVLTNEDIGLDSDSKEAAAFAVLANEALRMRCNNVPGATGANHSVVMGKITL